MCTKKLIFLFGLNNILFIVLLTYYDIYIHTIYLGFDGKRSYFSTKKDGSFELPKHMLKLMGKKIFTLLRLKNVFI